MPFDKLKYPEELREERGKRVAESLQTVSLAELKTIAKQHIDEFVDDPARDEFLRLMEEEPQATYYRAMAQDDLVIFYCRDADFGVWVVPGSGIGPLDAAGKEMMKEAIEGAISGRKIGEKK